MCTRFFCLEDARCTHQDNIPKTVCKPTSTGNVECLGWWYRHVARSKARHGSAQIYVDVFNRCVRARSIAPPMLRNMDAGNAWSHATVQQHLQGPKCLKRPRYIPTDESAAPLRAARTLVCRVNTVSQIQLEFATRTQTGFESSF